MKPCPTEDTLARLVADTLPPIEFEPLEAHVERCGACQAVLDRLTRFADSAWLTPPPAARRPDPPRIAVPGCDVYEEIGRGGHGVVYRGRQLALDRPVAVKVLRAGAFATPAERERFLGEARAAAKLRHPHIAQVYAVGDDHGTPYLLMELVVGGDLSGRLADSPLPPRAAAALVEAVARAVQHAHANGVIHRDLKPANVLLGGDALDRPVVTDFGLARVVGPAPGATPTADAIGTPSYMAPEVAAGGAKSAGAAVDVYALGAILYECLTGRPPFRGATPFDTILMVRQNDPVPPRLFVPSVPADLETVCLACLRKDPAARPPSAAAVADDLHRFLDGRPVLTRPPSAVARVTAWGRRRPRSAAALAAAVALAVVVGALEEAHAGRAREAEARTQSKAIATAAASQVEKLVADLDGLRPLARPHLKAFYESARPGSAERFNLALALLPDEPALADELLARAASGSPEEVLAVRAISRPTAGEWPALWARAAARTTPPAEALRLAVLLAGWQPDDGRWADLGPLTGRHLVRESPLLLGQWADGLRPVRRHLIAPLAAAATDGDRPDTQRVAAAAVLANYAAGDPERLVGVLVQATPGQFEPLLAALRPSDRAVPLLRAALADPAALSDPGKGRFARAAVALFRLGHPQPVWEALAESGPDRSRRSAVLHAAFEYGVPREALVGRVAAATAAERRAVLLALGDYPPAEGEPDAGLRQSALALYEGDPDPGVHAAAGWLLRQRLGAAAAADAAELRARGQSVAGRAWSVSRTGVPLAHFAPVERYSGGRTSRPGAKLNIEEPFEGRVRRPFALAAREVTVREFNEFLAAHPAVAKGYTAPNNSAPDLDEPILSVTWVQAAQFCRWLSDKEKVPEADMCYPKVAEIKTGMALKPGFLLRTGYRLPTELEWEYACRGGTRTLREYGSAPGRLARYGWHLGTRDDRPGPVASKWPSDAGLFDVYGNAWEWTHPVPGKWGQDGVREDFADDPAPTVRATDGLYHPIARGGSYLYHEPFIYSARRYPIPPDKVDGTVGFRIARTLPSAD